MAYTISDIDVFVMTHNRAELLKETIDSLLAQTVCPDRITVFDNESEDNTRAVVNHYRKKHVKYVKTTGRNGNFHAMQKYSKRRYVVHFHDDNLIHPDYFERVLKVLNTVDNVAGVTGAYTYFYHSYEGKWLLNTGYHLMEDYLIIDNRRQFAIHKIRAESPPYDLIVDFIGAMVYRGDYFRKRVDMTWKYAKGDDLDVCMSLFDYGRMVTVSDRNSVFIRQHEKRDMTSDENSMTLEQAFNWLGLYIDAAGDLQYILFWKQFVGLIYTQYPYFVKRSVFQTIPTDEFLRKVIGHFSLGGTARKACEDYLNNTRTAVKEYVHPKVRHFRPLRKLVKGLCPYCVVRLVQKIQIKYDI